MDHLILASQKYSEEGRHNHYYLFTGEKIRVQKDKISSKSCCLAVVSTPGHSLYPYAIFFQI